MPAWDASLYLKFASERTQPSIDLASRIDLDAPRTIVDVGCGPGNSTMVLRRRWPSAHIVGLDHSAAMIEAARRDHPVGHWELADIVEWFRGTGLRPYLDALEPDESQAFITAFGAELDVAYRPQADGKVLFPFPRLFFVAYR